MRNTRNLISARGKRQAAGNIKRGNGVLRLSTLVVASVVVLVCATHENAIQNVFSYKASKYL